MHFQTLMTPVRHAALGGFLCAALVALPALAQTKLGIPAANVSASSSDATNSAQWLQYNLGRC